MNLIIFIAVICASIVAVTVAAVIQDEKRIKEEADLRPCTQTDCYFNDGLMCRSLTDSWNPALLDNCPDYTED